jgi:hypothetical protein
MPASRRIPFLAKMTIRAPYWRTCPAASRSLKALLTPLLQTSYRDAYLGVGMGPPGTELPRMGPMFRAHVCRRARPHLPFRLRLRSMRLAPRHPLRPHLPRRLQLLLPRLLRILRRYILTPLCRPVPPTPRHPAPRPFLPVVCLACPLAMRWRIRLPR